MAQAKTVNITNRNKKKIVFPWLLYIMLVITRVIVAEWKGYTEIRIIKLSDYLVEKIYRPGGLQEGSRTKRKKKDCCRRLADVVRRLCQQAAT